MQPVEEHLRKALGSRTTVAGRREVRKGRVNQLDAILPPATRCCATAKQQLGESCLDLQPPHWKRARALWEIAHPDPLTTENTAQGGAHG